MANSMCSMPMDTKICIAGIVGFCSIFDKQAVELFKGVKEVGKTDAKDELQQIGDEEGIGIDVATEKSGLSCLICQLVQFESLEAQRGHFKLDWHRFNVKQKLMNKSILSEEEFEETISGELSSISGSDTSDSEPENDAFSMESSPCLSTSALTTNDETPIQLYRHHPKVFLSDENNTVFTLYRAVVYSSKFIPENDNDFIARIRNTLNEKVWLIIMTAGGHFAGAVFDGDEVVAHKTFHRYTVRAKRGTAQGMRDSQQGKMPKSAGATLRRYNEAALAQEVQALLESWSDHRLRCHKVFIRVPTYSQGMFFGGKNPPFRKDDPRIRTIPFATRRPTFNEVKRVHQQLSKLHILGKQTDVEMDRIMSEIAPPAKSLPQPTNKAAETAAHRDERDSDRANKEGNDRFHGVNESEERPNSGSKKSKKKSSKAKKPKSREETISTSLPSQNEAPFPERCLWNRLHCAVVAGNMDMVCKLLVGTGQNQTNRHLQPINGTQTPSLTENMDDQIETPNLTDNMDDQIETPSLTDNLDDQIETPSLTDNLDDQIEPSNDVNFEASNLPGIASQDATRENGCVDQFTDNLKTERTLESQELNDNTVHGGERAATTGNPDIASVVNQRWGEGSSTLLHTAARSSHVRCVYRLLDMGANPVIRDDRGRTPYDAADNKEARNEFRRFMADFPDTYDYSLAHVPSPLTQDKQEEKEQKEAEKKKSQRKARKQRTKEKKIIEEKAVEEKKEMERLSKLSDREKRALAAERRLTQRQTTSSSSKEQCESCAMCFRSLEGRVPFERMSYKYCNTVCVREHRLVLENKD